MQVDALWQPDLHLLPGNVCNAVQGLEGITSDRVGVKCSVCERSDGAVIRCSQGHCSVPFHPLCARNAGHYLSVHPTGNKTVYRAFCANHSQQARNKDRDLGISIEVGSCSCYVQSQDWQHQAYIVDVLWVPLLSCVQFSCQPCHGAVL